MLLVGVYSGGVRVYSDTAGVYSDAAGVYRGNYYGNGDVPVFVTGCPGNVQVSIFAPKHENVSHDV